MIDNVTNWQKRLRDRLYKQFRSKANFVALADLIARQVQDLENAGQALLAMINIDTSSGAQLDLLGRVVGQLRLGATDAVYRTYLRARIQINRSRGTTEDLYKIFRPVFGASGYKITTHPWKTFVLQILTPITSAQSSLALQLLRDGKEAGARGLLYWQESASGVLFKFDTVGQGLDIGEFTGQAEA